MVSCTPHVFSAPETDMSCRSSAFVPDTASPYMQELTRYLSNIMSSVLLGLPPQIKELIYFDALSHISASLLALPLDQSIQRISPQAVTAYRLDVDHLVEFVTGLGDTVLLTGLDELRQTVELMSTASIPGGRAEEEFFDMEKSRRRYGRVDRANGAELLEKYVARMEVSRTALTCALQGLTRHLSGTKCCTICLDQPAAGQEDDDEFLQLLKQIWSFQGRVVEVRSYVHSPALFDFCTSLAVRT